jgi:hypothetical protein
MLRQSVLEGEEVLVNDTPMQEGIEPLLGLLCGLTGTMEELIVTGKVICSFQLVASLLVL